MLRMTAPRTNNYTAQNVSSIQVEKQYFGGRELKKQNPKNCEQILNFTIGFSLGEALM